MRRVGRREGGLALSKSTGPGIRKTGGHTPYPWVLGVALSVKQRSGTSEVIFIYVLRVLGLHGGGPEVRGAEQV